MITIYWAYSYLVFGLYALFGKEKTLPRSRSDKARRSGIGWYCRSEKRLCVRLPPGKPGRQADAERRAVSSQIHMPQGGALEV